MSQAALTTRVATGRRKRHANGSGATWGSPTTYLVATILIAVCIAPVLYIIIGGFRTNSQITVRPGRLAEAMGGHQLPSGPVEPRLLAGVRQLVDLRSGDHGRRRGARPDGVLRHRPIPVRRTQRDVLAVRRRLDVSADRGHHAAVPADQEPGSDQHLVGIILPQIAFALPQL